jgi:hypothetical protein
MVKQKMETLLTCSIHFTRYNLIMELKFPCKTFQQHFSRNGTNIFKMVQIYEE